MIRLTAAEAAKVHPPVGQHKDRSLAEIFALDVGPRWLRWALWKSDDLARNDKAFGEALWAFAETYAPHIHAEAVAALEAKTS